MNTQWLRWCAAAAVGLILDRRSLRRRRPTGRVPPNPSASSATSIGWAPTIFHLLITSPDGHIVINTGLADSVPQIRANIEQLGFRTADVKILTATHAHWDHVAGWRRSRRSPAPASTCRRPTPTSSSRAGRAISGGARIRRRGSIRSASTVGSRTARRSRWAVTR